MFFIFQLFERFAAKIRFKAPLRKLFIKGDQIGRLNISQKFEMMQNYLSSPSVRSSIKTSHSCHLYFSE